MKMFTNCIISRKEKTKQKEAWKGPFRNKYHFNGVSFKNIQSTLKDIFVSFNIPLSFY